MWECCRQVGKDGTHCGGDIVLRRVGGKVGDEYGAVGVAKLLRCGPFAFLVGDDGLLPPLLDLLPALCAAGAPTGRLIWSGGTGVGLLLTMVLLQCTGEVRQAAVPDLERSEPDLGRHGVFESLYRHGGLEDLFRRHCW